MSTKIRVAGQNFDFVDTLQNAITVPDCWVLGANKLGNGHGEAKLYIGSKETMHEFFGEPGFEARCFILKSDLLNYMDAVKKDYLAPTQEYRGKNDLPGLWRKHVDKISSLPDVIEFTVKDQNQIAGPRGYINTDGAKGDGFQLLREVSLPLISYLSTMKLSDHGHDIYYWKIFADYAEMQKRRAFIYAYGRKEQEEPKKMEFAPPQTKQARRGRDGQDQYRQSLLDNCPYCPITMLTEDSLLIASHIKPWAVSDEKEKVDPNNGFILSPLYDKLFDRGFITFDCDKEVHISQWLSPRNKRLIGISEGQRFNLLPMGKEREHYLDFHQKAVFRG